MSDSVFERLRTLVFERVGPAAEAIAYRSDLVPIEQTEDGWLCLLANGHVAHVSGQGLHEELVRTSRQATALIGNLSRRFPIATWFIPGNKGAIPCPACAGTGRVLGLPADLGNRVVCQCGGLGWLPSSDDGTIGK